MDDVVGVGGIVAIVGFLAFIGAIFILLVRVGRRNVLDPLDDSKLENGTQATISVQTPRGIVELAVNYLNKFKYEMRSDATDPFPLFAQEERDGDGKYWIRREGKREFERVDAAGLTEVLRGKQRLSLF